MIKISFAKLKRFSNIFKSHYKMANVSDGAVVLSFYVLLSLFPILIIVGNLFRLFHFNAINTFQNNRFLLPESVRTTLEPIILSTLKGSSNGQFSFGIVITLFSASRAVAAFQRTVNNAYGIERKPNAFFNRLTSFLWLALIMIVSGLIMAVFTVGHFLLDTFAKDLITDHDVLILFQSLSWVISILVLLGVFNLLFYFVPNAETKFRYTWQGAVFATIGLFLLSQFFSLYIHYFMRSVSTYQTLSAFIILIFWLYLLGMILLFGAVLNASIQEYKMGPIRQRNVRAAVDQKIKQRHL